ncbi:MAG: major facilitator superfamily transporter [Proteobacteria bacterium]|nr:major facilitator superfamily transporter [Pseudomonadota bacterium]
METPKSSLGRYGLIVLMAGQLLPLIDFSIVNVALDTIAHALHATETQLELLVAVYGVSFAVCLALGGRLGDNLGRRRIFTIGVAAFGLASLLCGLADSIRVLLAARVLQGMSAALLMPQVLATIHVCLSGPRHTRALALYGGIGGLAFVIGQVLGGLLVSADIWGLGWRSVFLINLPVCGVVLASIRHHIPDTRREHVTRIDWAGTLVLAALILSILLPLSLGPAQHWSWPWISALTAALPLLALLWHMELRQARRGIHPLLPPTVMRLHSVRFGLVIALLFFTCWSGFIFVLARTVQAGAGMSPLQSGNAFVAMGITYFLGALVAPRSIARLGPIGSLLLGCAIQMPALLALIGTLDWVWPHLTILNLMPATAVLTFGQAFIVASFYRIGMADVPASEAGAGSAVLTTVQQTALGLGAPVLGAVFVHFLPLSYLQGARAALVAELFIMCLLVASALLYRLHLRPKVLPQRCPA